MSGRPLAIPLEIEDALTERGVTGRIPIVIEGIPPGATLSAGINNWDSTWSLMAAEARDLQFLPPMHNKNGLDDYTLSVRVLNLDEDGFNVGTTAALFDITVENPFRRHGAEGLSGDVAQRLAEAEAAWKAEHRRALAEAEARWKAEHETALAEAHAQWRAEEEARLDKLKAVWDSEHEKRLADLKGDVAASEKERLAAELAAREAENEGRLAAAEQAWQAAEERRLSEARKAWNSELKQALAEAEAKWSAEHEQRLARLREDLAAQESQRLSSEIAAHDADRDKRLAAAEQAWREQEEQRLAEAKNAWEAEREQALAEARQAWTEEAEQTLAVTREAWEAEREQVLAEAQQAWEADQKQRLAESETAWGSESEKRLADLKKDILAEQDRRLAGELAARDAAHAEQLAAAKQAWQAEEEQRLIEARRAWEADGKQSSAEAEAAWQARQEQVLAEARTEWKAEEDKRLTAARAEWERHTGKRLAEVEKASRDKDEELERMAAMLRRKQERRASTPQGAPDHDGAPSATTAEGAAHGAAGGGKIRQRSRFSGRAASALFLEPAYDDTEGNSAKAKFKYYSEPDRRMIAKRAIAQAEREAEERKIALQERRHQARAEKLRIMGRLHSRAVRRLTRPRREARTGLPWPQLAAACCAGLAILAVSISPPDFVLPGTGNVEEWVAAPAASPEPVPDNRLFVRPALINLRAGPTQESPALAQMIRGTAVLELERKADWIKVALPGNIGTEGWIHSSLLSPEPPADTTP